MPKPRPRKRGLVRLGAVALLAEMAVLAQRGYRLTGGDVVVRCSDGHVFTTIWIPGASVKSLRLGPWRVQRCPVGHHWAIVTPVSRSELTPLARLRAARRRDVRIP